MTHMLLLLYLFGLFFNAVMNYILLACAVGFFYMYVEQTIMSEPCQPRIYLLLLLVLITGLADKLYSQCRKKQERLAT